MDMNVAKNKTINLLLSNKNPNAKFYADTFYKYKRFGIEIVPISPLFMGNVDEKNIIITEEVFEKLLKIRNITRQTNLEISYFILGEEKNDGTILLDKVISNCSSKNIIDLNIINQCLNKYAETIDVDSKQIICCGHTHGTGFFSDNFSFGDLISLVKIFNEYNLSYNGEVEIISMIMPPCGDYNFIMYNNNPQAEGFYKFPNVYLKHNDSTIDILPSYVSQNYVKEVNLQKK